MKSLDYFNDFAKKNDERAWNADTVPWAKWAWDILIKEIGIAQNSVIVDLGTGTGAGIEYLLPRTKNSEFIGVDFSEEMIRIAKSKFNNNEKIQFIVCDLEKLELDNNSIDYFISAGTFHHIENKEKVFSIIWKALKPDGKFINMDHFEPKQKYINEMNNIRSNNPNAASENDVAYEKIKWIYEEDKNHPIEFHIDPYEFKELLEACNFHKAVVHVSYHPKYSVITATK